MFISIIERHEETNDYPNERFKKINYKTEKMQYQCLKYQKISAART